METSSSSLLWLRISSTLAATDLAYSEKPSTFCTMRTSERRCCPMASFRESVIARRFADGHIQVVAQLAVPGKGVDGLGDTLHELIDVDHVLADNVSPLLQALAASGGCRRPASRERSARNLLPMMPVLLIRAVAFL